MTDEPLFPDQTCAGCGAEHPGLPCPLQDALPTILPSVTGVPGIVGLDPVRIQCQQCGVIDDPDTLGCRTAHRNPSLAVVLSDIRFHADLWSSGHTDNPRLCRDCRQARGCTCTSCSDERRCPPKLRHPSPREDH